MILAKTRYEPDLNTALRFGTPGSARENSLRLFRQIIKRRFLGKTLKKEREERNAPHSKCLTLLLLLRSSNCPVTSLWHPAEISRMEATHDNVDQE